MQKESERDREREGMDPNSHVFGLRKGAGERSHLSVPKLSPPTRAIFAARVGP